QGCSSFPPVTFPHTYASLMRDPDQPMAWGSYFQSGPGGAVTYADQIQLSSSMPQPTGVTAEVEHTMKPNNIPLYVFDMDGTPLGTYPTQGFYDVTYTLGQAGQTTLEFHTLDNTMLDGYRFLNMGTSMLPQVQVGAGLASLPANLTANATRFAPFA